MKIPIARPDIARYQAMRRSHHNTSLPRGCVTLAAPYLHWIELSEAKEVVEKHV